MITRFLENELILNLSLFPAVAVLGPRQVGKTTLVKQISSQLANESVYLDMENPEHRAIVETDRSLFFENNQHKTIILDEVQRLPALFAQLRGIIDNDRTAGRFLFLGSASYDLLRNTSESLTGRIAYLELTPFLYAELPNAAYQTHWFRGGFALSYLATNETDRRLWFRNFMMSYLEKDLPQLGLRATPQLTARLLSMLAYTQGSQANYSSVANSLGISQPTVVAYIDFLERALLVRRLMPYFVNVGKRLVKSPKIYIRDSGMVHHLLNITDFNNLLGHPVAGGSWEGYIIEQIIGRLSYPHFAFYYRTSDGAELDLVIELASQIKLAIEIKLSNTPQITKGTTQALQDFGNVPCLVVTPSATDYLLRPDVQVCSLATLPTHLRRFGLIE